MTELEKRLKHIEETNNKRVDTYRKSQEQAEKNYNKIVEINQNKYLNNNLEKETKKATNSKVKLADTNLNNYNTVKKTVDNYVSQRNRNDENVRVFTPKRNQAKSNQIVNNIYGRAGQQAEEDKYSSTIDKLNDKKKALEEQRKSIAGELKNLPATAHRDDNKKSLKMREANKQISEIDNQIENTKKQHQDDLLQKSMDSVYAGNGTIDESIQGYVAGQDINLLKAEVEKNPELQHKRQILIKKQKEDEKYSLDAKANELINNYDENEKKQLNAKSYNEWVNNLDEKAEIDNDTIEEYNRQPDNSTLFYAKLNRGMELACESITNNQDSVDAIKLGIYETTIQNENPTDEDTDFSRLTREEDKIRYYYLRGKYGKKEASEFALYAVQQANTAKGLKEAYENDTLDEFINAGKSGFNSFGKGLIGWFNSHFGGLKSSNVQGSDYDILNSASDVTFEADKTQAGGVKKFALDAVNTTANQLPSIGISLLPGGQTAGIASLSASAAGNAYNQAVLEGKTDKEALVYGTTQGLMEFVTGKVLGGQFGMNGVLEKYGSKALENVIPKLVENETFATYAYQAGKVLINSAGEFNEEAIQQLLEPYIRNIAFGENNKQTLQNVEDALYSGLLGLASAGMTNTAGEVTTGAVNAISNKIQNKKLAKFFDNLIQSESPSQNLIENTKQNEITEAPSVEAVISEAETNQETAKRISKVIDKIDKGETVTNSEIAELKYNKTASAMIEQMAGLKQSKITSSLDNDTVRSIINEAKSGKKNIDTASILSNIRSNLNSTQNIAENTNENVSGEVLNANEGNLTGDNQTAVESVSEPYSNSQLNEVGEAMPRNIQSDYTNNPVNSIENISNNARSTYNKVENDSNKIFKLGISNKKSGMTNIRRVQSIDNGVVQLLMSNGDVVSADALDFSNNQNAEIILKNAGKYNSSTANTFIANYDSSRSTPQAYSTAFNSVYKMSKVGMSFEAVASEASAARGILGKDSFNAAIRAGRNTAKGVFSDRTGSNAKNTAKTKTTDEVSRTDKSASKLVTSSAKKNISQNNNTVKANKTDVKKSAKEFSKALGVKINVYESDSSIRGYEQNGEIFINESWVNKKANSASEFNYILAHELTHTLEESDYYNQLKSFILNSRIYDDSLKLRDTTHTEEIRTRQELYEKKGKKLTKEQAERELIADFIADELLTNEECIKELVYKDKKLFVKIKEFVNKMIDTLKRFVKNSSNITQAQKDLIHIKQLYKKAFDDVKKNGTYSNEIKYSKKLGGYNPEIKVTTDNVLEEYGIKNINAKYEVIKKVAHKLENNYLSTDKISKPITNIDTGLKIEIRKSGIKETFGNPKYYSNLTNDLKLAKIASMSELAKMIKYGEVRAKDSYNYHNPRSEAKFSYLKSSINIDGVNYDVTIDIKRLPSNENIFYIHNLKIKKQKTNSLHRIAANGLSVNLPLADNNISQNNDIVNNNILENSDNDTKFSIDDDLKNLNDKYGTKKKGENPVRDIDVPEKSSENKRVREFVKTILESDALPDEMVNEVSQELVKDTLSYEPISNKNVLKVANEWLENGGNGITGKHWRDWEVISSRGHKVTALDVAKGELLLRSAAQNNDTPKVLKLTAEISEMATTAGQTVQAMRLLKKSTGLGQLYYAEKTVRRMNADYEVKYKNRKKGVPHISINEDLALELAQAKTETQKETAAENLYKDIGKQVPSNWVDKWNAWRYMSMLTNPTTHIRNLVGNVIFMPAVNCKNTIAYGLESAFIKDGERTKAIKVKDEYKAFAEQDYNNVEDELTGNGKYESTDMIQSNKVIFKNKVLEGVRNLNGNLLETEDAIFLKHHYKRALSMYLQSNKIPLNELSDFKAENARKAAIDKGRIYAIKEAQKATYRDASKLADSISEFSKSHKAAGIVVEGVIPFKKTPINVAKRAVEYSPAGLIKALTFDIAKLRHSEISASEYIDRISAGITGTGLTALGLFLGHLGLIKVGLGDDDKEQGLKKLEGHQEYSIELFGYSYTFDWACPAAIPIFIGAKAGEMLNGENEGLTFADYEDLTTTMLDPMFEMSVLSGIDNLIQNVKYSESPVVDTGLYAVSSYLGQAVPTLGGKIAGTIDGTRRSSYIDKSKDTFVSKNFTSSQQQFVNKIVKKIPGATYLLEPYINEWGEQEEQDNVGVRIFQNYISPGYISKIEVDEVEKMLEDTYKESGNNTVLPTKSKKYFSVNGDTVHLTADEYTTYATVRGQMAHSILKDLSNNTDFKSAESADKANLISKVYELSNAIAKQGVSDYKPDGWINKATEANEKGMSYSDFLVMRERLNEISGEGTKEKRYNKIRRMNISKSAKETLWKSFNYDMSLGGERIYFY